MTERPIMFSGAMVRAILDGRKTQTRRVVTVGDTIEERDDGTPWPYYTTWTHGEDGTPWAPCPYGKPGDRLWVRETWRYHDWTEDGLPWIRYAADDAHRLCENIPDDWRERVCDAWAELSDPDNYAIDGAARDRVWRPSIFLPRWASRLTLDVTEVRVERLQAITEEDAISEGIDARCDHGCSSLCGCAMCIEGGCPTATSKFEELWDAINGKRAPWSSNPWVWVVGFRRVEVKP